MRLELLHSGDFRQCLRVLAQMDQGNEGMGLAAAERHVQLANRLFRLSRQPPHHIAGKVAEFGRGIGQREEFLGVVVDRWMLAHHHIVQIGGELFLRQFFVADIRTELDNFMPGLGSKI